MRILLSIAFASLSCFAAPSGAQAQDISGVWQGMTRGQRVFEISRTPNGDFKGEMYLPREMEGTLNGNPISKIDMTNGVVKFQTDRKYGIYEGKLSQDGQTITGTWRNTAGAQPLVLTRSNAKDRWEVDPSPHKVFKVAVGGGVNVEVLDWGGKGRPLILLGGQGNSAHVFDDFALKLVNRYRVIAVTRRGFGGSDMPSATEENYDPDRLGDDVVIVADALKLRNPIIAGHSIAGQELSAIGTRHPEKVAALIYLDAAYGYAFYDSKAATEDTSWGIESDMAAIRRSLERLPGAPTDEAEKLSADVQESLERVAKGIARYRFSQPSYIAPQTQVINAMTRARRKYRGTNIPTLAIFAAPHDCGGSCNEEGEKKWMAAEVAQASAFAAGNPKAKVISWPKAPHYLFLEREVDTLREMNSFIESLPN